MIEVFKTTVQTPEEAAEVLKALSLSHSAFEINFDLEDCDKILRVAGEYIDHKSIIQIVSQFQHECEVLL